MVSQQSPSVERGRGSAAETRRVAAGAESIPGAKRRARGRPRKHGPAQTGDDVSSSSSNVHASVEAGAGAPRTRALGGPQARALDSVPGDPAVTSSTETESVSSASEYAPVKRELFAPAVVTASSSPQGKTSTVSSGTTHRDPMARALQLCKSPRRVKLRVVRMSDTSPPKMMDAARSDEKHSLPQVLTQQVGRQASVAAATSWKASPQKDAVSTRQGSAAQGQEKFHRDLPPKQRAVEQLTSQTSALISTELGRSPGKEVTHPDSLKQEIPALPKTNVDRPLKETEAVTPSTAAAENTRHVSRKPSASRPASQTQKQIHNQRIDSKTVEEDFADVAPNKDQDRLDTKAAQVQPVQQAAENARSSDSGQPATASKPNATQPVGKPLHTAVGVSMTERVGRSPQKDAPSSTDPKKSSASAGSKAHSSKKNAEFVAISKNTATGATSRNQGSDPGFAAAPKASPQTRPADAASKPARKRGSRQAAAPVKQDEPTAPESNTKQGPAPVAKSDMSRPTASAQSQNNANVVDYYAVERLGMLQFSDQWQLFFDHDKRQFYPVHFAILPTAGDEVSLRRQLENDDRMQRELRELVVTICRLPVLPPRFVSTPSLLVENVLERRENWHGLLAGKYALWLEGKRIPLAKFWYTFRIHQVR
jgi:hypothetical protein